MSYMYDKINIQEIKKSNLKKNNKNLEKYKNIKFNKKDIDVILYHKFCNDGYGSVFAIENYYLKNNLNNKLIIKKGLKPAAKKIHKEYAKKVLGFQSWLREKIDRLL